MLRLLGIHLASRNAPLAHALVKVLPLLVPCECTFTHSVEELKDTAGIDLIIEDFFAGGFPLSRCISHICELRSRRFWTGTYIALVPSQADRADLLTADLFMGGNQQTSFGALNGAHRCLCQPLDVRELVGHITSAGYIGVNRWRQYRASGPLSGLDKILREEPFDESASAEGKLTDLVRSIDWDRLLPHGSRRSRIGDILAILAGGGKLSSHDRKTVLEVLDSELGCR